MEARSRLPENSLIRITTFRVAIEKASLLGELRRIPVDCRAQITWVGRRLMDDPGGAEVVIATVWTDADAMRRDVEAGRVAMSDELRTAIETSAVQTYACRAFGAWERDDQPCLLRIFHGGLVEGHVAAFDPETSLAYLANFERNPRCVAIAAGAGAGDGIVLVTLWTNWDAVVSATGGDLRQVLPVRMEGWAVAGAAIHYEVVAAQTR